MSYRLERGDIVLTQGRSLLSALIRTFQRPITTKYLAPWNHALIVHEGGSLLTARIFEADKRVREGLLAQFHLYDRLWVYRPRNINSEQLDRIMRRIAMRVGHSYPYLEFLPELIDNWLLGGVVATRWLNRLIPGVKCSNLLAVAMWPEKFRFGKKDFAATPDDIGSFCSHEAWRDFPPERIYEVIATGIRPSDYLSEAA